jgi:hypothetical protein
VVLASYILLYILHIRQLLLESKKMMIDGELDDIIDHRALEALYTILTLFMGLDGTAGHVIH